MPACVDFATDPCTSNWNTDSAVRARNSESRRQRGFPERAAPFPARPSRTKSTWMFHPLGRCARGARGPHQKRYWRPRIDISSMKL